MSAGSLIEFSERYGIVAAGSERAAARGWFNALSEISAICISETLSEPSET